MSPSIDITEPSSVQLGLVARRVPDGNGCWHCRRTALLKHWAVSTLRIKLSGNSGGSVTTFGSNYK